MRRKSVLSLLLALCLCAGLFAVPAGAYCVVERPNPDGGVYYTFEQDPEARDWWAENYSNYFSNGSNLTNFFQPQDFRDGLMLIENCNISDHTTMYIDKDGQIHDLNNGRYGFMYPFSEGIAAGWRENEHGEIGQLCYIDTQGNELFRLNETINMVGDWFVGRFENGRCCVTRCPGGKGDYLLEPFVYDVASGTYKKEKYFNGFEYAYVDTKGNLVTDWTLVKELDDILALPLYNYSGVWIGHYYSEANCAKDAIAVDAYRAAKGDEIGGADKSGYVPELHRPELPAYDLTCESHFASTGEITGFHLADMNLGGTTLTITNPTGMTDSGVIAMALCCFDNTENHTTGVFFVPYKLGPYESGDYTVFHHSILNWTMFTSDPTVVKTYAQQLEGHVAATVFEFSDDADLHSFYDAVPYEQYKYVGTLANDFQQLCDSEAGTQWLLEVAGISRAEPVLEWVYYHVPDPKSTELIGTGDQVDHSICWTDWSGLDLGH